MSQLWIDIAAKADVALDQPKIDQLHAYLQLLAAANEKMNLTRIESPEAAELLHVADSLTLLPFLPREPHSLADVGSGGGLPGLPLAIVRPDVRVTLIDATLKKAAFLEQTAAQLGLKNVKVLPQRSELIRGPQWNIVTARGLAPMEQLVLWCLPLVKPGGKLLAMKGPKGRDELPSAEPAIKHFRGLPAIVHEANLPGRSHIIIEIERRG